MQKVWGNWLGVRENKGLRVLIARRRLSLQRSCRYRTGGSDPDKCQSAPCPRLYPFKHLANLPVVGDFCSVKLGCVEEVDVAPAATYLL